MASYQEHYAPSPRDRTSGPSFREQLEATQRRVDGLQRQAGESADGRSEVLVEALGELGSILDELQGAEAELRRQHAELAQVYASADAERRRYRELFDLAPDGYLVTDMAAVVQEANHTATELLNASDKRIIGERLATFVPQEARSAFRDRLRRSWQDQTRQEWEMPLQPRGREAFAAVLSVAPVRDREGRPVALRWLVRNVTERKRAEDARAELIREQAARAEAEAAVQTLHFLVDASRVLSSSLDYQTTLQSLANLAVWRLADWCTINVLEASGRARRAATASRDPAKTRLLDELGKRYPPDPNAPHPQSRVLQTGDPEFVPVVAEDWLAARCRSDEHFRMVQAIGFVSYMCVPLVARGQMLGTLALVRSEPGQPFEHTELELAEELARRAALALDNARLYREAQEAFQARSELLAVISHDLGNPLTVIKAYAQLLQRTQAADSGTPLAGIEAATTTMQRLLGQLADAARLEMGEQLQLSLGWVDLFEVAERLVAQHQATTQNHELSLSGEGSGRVVGRWDCDRLERIIDNLLSNAIKYSPGGGRIEVSVKRRGRSARLAVRDPGLGIRAEALHDLFKPFQRVNQLTGQGIGGLGLGLFSAQRMAHLHGGRIEVTSEEGKGSEFTLVLPIAGPR